ncbi:MAG: 1-acyl-sn-glycerol-3-phosphate acyltransferase [bacterium]|nr:1-acyl-sn-glycerol-3-phosphate acyltransferase [bacterium]
MIKKIDLLLALFFSLLMSFLVIKINKPYEFWIPILLFIGAYASLIILWFVFIFVFSLFINTKKEYDKQNFIIDKIISLTMELLLNLSHTKIIKENIDLVPKDERFLFVYNHTSNFDPIVINHTLKKSQIIHVSKPENFKIPIAGPFVYRNCYLAIDRKNDRNALKTIVRCIKFVKEDKFSIGIAPEGTRNKVNEKQLLPFRDGCFQVATKSKCKIVICALSGLNKIHKNFPFKRTKIKMSILKVLDYEDYKDLQTRDISKIVRDLITNKLNESGEK